MDKCLKIYIIYFLHSFIHSCCTKIIQTNKPNYSRVEMEKGKRWLMGCALIVYGYFQMCELYLSNSCVGWRWNRMDALWLSKLSLLYWLWTTWNLYGYLIFLEVCSAFKLFYCNLSRTYNVGILHLLQVGLWNSFSQS